MQLKCLNILFKIYNNNQKKEVIILEINKNIFKRTIEYFKKQRISPRLFKGG